ncbi:MAG: glycerophosphodiester phosphodiesterase family protein [Clostridia bacterium]|nr:glycerophosphodiester phosphodiesterase family protein [Clostridia bacterium]
MELDLYAKAKEKIIIAAHRGSSTGNIPCNTLPAYRAALLEGADMIEIDVDKSADGELFIFHPCMEAPHLGVKCRISEMAAKDVKELRYLNYDRTPTQFGLNTVDEVFEEFRGKCFINVDKFWMNPEDIYKAIKRHGVTEQVIVKSSVNERVIATLRDLCPELPFMSIVRDTHPMHEALMNTGINYVGAEVLFAKEGTEVSSPEFIEMMHRDGKLVWVNSLIYNYRDQLAGDHSDDTALTVSPDYGWGWLARRGFDIIQTDRTALLNLYLKESSLLYKK